MWWTDTPLPGAPILGNLQSQGLASLRLSSQVQNQGLGLLAQPEFAGSLSSLSTLPGTNKSEAPGIPTTNANTGSAVLASTELPLWIKAAIKMGTRFLRIAAATEPAAVTPYQSSAKRCCSKCNEIHPPVVDEFYFWLADSRYFDSTDAPQNADLGANPPDPTSDWDRAEKLPNLLHWSSERMIHLCWCRVHFGRFNPPRRSDEGMAIQSTIPVSPLPKLGFFGRTADRSARE